MSTRMATTWGNLVSSVFTAWLINLLGPTCTLVTAQSTANSTSGQFLDWVQNNPEYVAMAGMGLVILLLFITTIVVICTVGTNKNKY